MFDQKSARALLETRFNPLPRGAKQRPMTDISLIRNFSIIAHIDHGKSTLSDRLIQLCGNVTIREMKEQILDSMEIERERGITIKAQTVRLDYKAKDGKTYQLNLMDTPGHVDFAYEVSRSLAACEGAVLVVDASQGVEAQTLANVYQALDNDLEILPVLNKVDLPSADADRVKQQIEDVIGLDASHAIPISAKTGQNVEAVLEAIVERLPSPKGDANVPLKALLIDSWYDAYLGVVVLVRIIDGRLVKGQRIKLMASGGAYQVERVGIFRPKQEMLAELGPGEVGFFTAAIKQVADTRVGDTVTDERKPTVKAAAGLQAGAAGGVLRPLPGRCRPVRGPARGDGAAAPQRRQLLLRGGDVGRARLRLPLRLPGAIAPRDHHRAARAGVRPRPHHHGAQRHLSRLPLRRLEARDAQPRRHARPRTASTASRSRGSRPPSWCRTSIWAPS